VITKLSVNNNGTLGKIQLISDTSLFLNSTNYNTISQGIYVNYPGFQLIKLPSTSVSVSYTASIQTQTGPLTKDNITSLICSDIPVGNIGIFNNTSSYQNQVPISSYSYIIQF